MHSPRGLLPTTSERGGHQCIAPAYRQQARFSKMLILIGNSENAEQSYKVDGRRDKRDEASNKILYKN